MTEIKDSVDQIVQERVLGAPERVERYDARLVEEKWRTRWEADNLYRIDDADPRPKWYSLTMYPYPSGTLHVGHWYAFSVPDVYARLQRMRGYNVLFPMGFDAFGLPAENAAIRHGIHPAPWTFDNIDRMRDQYRQMGAMIDWSREVITCTPEDDVRHVMAEMTRRRVRHLPVVEGGGLAGIVSIGDVVKHHIGDLELQRDSLQAYISSGA